MERRPISPDLTKRFQVGRIEVQQEEVGQVPVLGRSCRAGRFVMRLRGLKIYKRPEAGFRVVPLYFAKGKGTMSAAHLTKEGPVLEDVILDVLQSLQARGDREV